MQHKVSKAIIGVSVMMALSLIFLVYKLSFSSSPKVNGHYPLENPVSVGTPEYAWVNDPTFHMLPPPTSQGYPPASLIPITTNSAAGSDAGAAIETAGHTYAPGKFSILSALKSEYPPVAALFGAAGGAASLFRPGSTVQEYISWGDLWTPSVGNSPIYIIGKKSFSSPQGYSEDNFYLTGLTSQIDLRDNFFIMHQYGVNGYQGQYPIDIRYQVGRRYFPVFTYQ